MAHRRRIASITLAALVSCCSSPTAPLDTARVDTEHGFVAVYPGDCPEIDEFALQSAWHEFRGNYWAIEAGVAHWPAGDLSLVCELDPHANGGPIYGKYSPSANSITYRYDAPHVVTHEAQHWVCYVAALPLDCLRVDHCGEPGGVRLTGEPCGV